MSGTSGDEVRGAGARRATSLSEPGRVPGLRQLVPSLSAGVLVGLVEIILAISFAALIFAGPLSGFVASGVGLILMAAIISGIAVALLTSLPGTISGIQDVPAAIMAVMAAAIVTQMPAGAGGREAFVTVVVAMGLTTLLTGVTFYGLGRFGLGSLVRFLPYPVVGGFLAGTGWLLSLGALGIMADVDPSLANLPLLWQPEQLIRWLPGVLLAIVLLVLSRSTEHFLVFPVALLGAVALFYVVAAASGTSVEALSAGGWLLGSFSETSLWQPLAPADLALVDWRAIRGQAVNMATIILLSTVSLLLNATGLELAVGQDVELDRELRAAGAGNVVAGLAGGSVGYQQLSLSVMNLRLGAGNRFAGLVAAAFCALVLLFGASLLSYFPGVVLGGLLLFLGLSFLVEWAIDTWFTLPRTDYAVVLLILAVTAIVGFLEAVGVGLLAAVVLFVINYSRIDVVHDELSGDCYQSRVTRRPEQRHFLRERGQEIFILRLQGFIFFGTADRLLERIQQRVQNPNLPPPRCLLLDFRRVTGIDSTALFSFEKLRQLAQAHHLALVLTELSPRVRDQLGESITGGRVVHLFPDLDRGLEWSERQVLEAAGMVGGAAQEANALRQELVRIVGSAEEVGRMLAYFERREVEAGHYLMRQGDAPDVLYFIESGQVTAQLEPEDGEAVRLQTMQGGHVLGEIGFFLGQERTAAVVADEPSVVYRLSIAACEQMRRQDPHMAATFYEVMVHLLSERVVHLVDAVNALRR